MSPARRGVWFSTSFPAIGTTASLVVTDESVAPVALDVLRGELAAMDLAASRFRDDSELVALNASAGSREPYPVSDLLFDAIQEALRAARLTGGLVDPTVGRALELNGYDRDFALIDPDGPPLRLTARSVPGWRVVEVDPSSQSITLPAGVTLDLGATAKALCADRAAARAASETGCGVLVSLGGDVAVAGDAPAGGWPVRISDDHASPIEFEGPTVAVSSGGLATSSTTVRRWVRGGTAVHHLIDPGTSLPAAERWRTVSVAASTCVDANIASCAAILLGESAPAWLSERALPARLVASGGDVTVVAGWPEERHAGEPVGAAR